MTESSEMEKVEVRDFKEIQRMLKSNSSEERVQAIHLLLKHDFPDINDLLQEIVLTDTQISIRELALISLIILYPQNQMPLLKKLFNNSLEKREIRSRAIWSLSKIRTEEAFELLKVALTDKEEEVLYWAIIGSISFDDFQEVLPSIRALLAKNRQYLIRQSAAWTLGMCLDTKAKKILETQLLADTHPSVRLVCTSSIIRLNDITSIPVLNKSLQKDANEMVRREIAYAIGVILDYQKIDSQKAESLQLKDYKTTAIRALSKVLLRDQSYIVRRACAESLGKINDKSAVKTLINAMTMDTNQFVRCEIAKTLGILGDPNAIEILEKASRSQYRKIVEAAKHALQQLQTSSE